MEIRIVLADDHKIIRDGLRALLDQVTDMEVVAEAENGYAAIKLIGEHDPDVVIMDVGMPDLNGVEATHQIKKRSPDTKVIALSVHSDTQFVAGMFRAGASAYLLKNSAFDELIQAIHEVSDNQTYLSPKIAGIVVEDYVHHLATSYSPASTPLTEREREVLQLLVEGKDTKKIASHLHVSVKTVATHRQHIMDKLDIHSLPELTKYALREGLTFLES